MNTFRKLIAVVILLTGVFTISLSVNAFKPTVTEYGHTSITQKVIGDNGYPAGHGGNSLIGLAQFQAILSSGKTITFSTEAAKHLVEGVQSNDWISGSFGEPDTLGESGPAKDIEGVSYRSVFKDRRHIATMICYRGLKGQDLRVRSPISQNKLNCHYG